MNLLRSLKSSYDNLKIQTKYTLCILIAVCIPVLTLTLAFSNQLYHMIVSDTIRSEQTISAQIAPQIESALSEIIDAQEQLASEPYYRTLFFQPVNTPLSKLAQTANAAAFADTVNTLTADGPLTAVRIYVDIPGQDAFFSSATANNLFLPISNARGTYWYGIFQGSRTSSLYCPSFYLGKKEIENYGDSAYITATSLYYNETSYPCYVALYYSSEPFNEILHSGISLPGSVSYILNERESLIATTDDYLAGIYRLNYTDIEDSLMSSNNFIERNVLGEKVYVGFYYIKEPAWMMVTVLPNDPLIEKSNLVILKLALVCIFCTLTAALLAIWQSRSITTRISSVVHQMTQIRKGIPVPMPSPSIHDEIGDLIDTYNYMTQKMNLLIEKQQKTAEELRIAEFNSLQAQINPHFLYNTMDMINWMALQGHTEKVSNVIQSLARFYKLTLSRQKNSSTIEDELEHVSIYVQLQNMRYQDAIDFVIDVPDELMEHQIPKLTLQPIVENAILHGILEKEEKTGTIVITGWMEDASTILLISDDGVGIPKDRLAKILTGQPIGSTSGTNIAVSNIHKRLKLLYGDNYGLSYTSTAGAGCDVKITLPANCSNNNS